MLLLPILAPTIVMHTFPQNGTSHSAITTMATGMFGLTAQIDTLTKVTFVSLFKLSTTDLRP